MKTPDESSRWRRATAWTLLATTLAACGAEVSPPAPDVTARAAPITRSASTTPGPEDPYVASLPAVRVDRIAYVTAALQASTPELDVLAGAALELATTPPPGTAAERLAAYQAAMAQAQLLLEAFRLPPERDASGTRYHGLERLLGRMVPTLGAGLAEDALRRYTRRFLLAGRPDDNLGAVESPFRRSASQDIEVRQFQAGVWEKLHEAAAADAAFAQAIDAGPIGQKLAVGVRDGALAILDHYPIEPLASFVREKRAADGSITVSHNEVNALVSASGEIANQASAAFSDVTFRMNRAQQEFLDATHEASPADGTSAIRAAGASAKPSAPAAASDDDDDDDLNCDPTTGTPAGQKPEDKLDHAAKCLLEERKGLVDTLDGVEAGVTGGLLFASWLADVAGKNDMARNFTQLSKAVVAFYDTAKKYSATAIKVAEAISKYLEVGETGFDIIGGAILTGGTVAAVAAALSVFGGSKDPNQAVLDRLKELKTLVQAMRDEMHERFDRVDKALNGIYGDMLDQFGRVNFELGKLEEDLDVVQSALGTISDQLDRLDHNLTELLTQTAEIDLKLGINGLLGYAERTGEPMSRPQFADGENLFFSWAVTQSVDFEAGGTERQFTPERLEEELGHPVPFNINFLREFPESGGLGQPKLAPDRLANPYTWMIAAESYAQLLEENPAAAAQGTILGQRLPQVIQRGEKLAAALDGITSQPLFTALNGYYSDRLNDLLTGLQAYENQYTTGQLATDLAGTTLFGGHDQTPSGSIFRRTIAATPCASGKVFGPGEAGKTQNVDLSRLDQNVVKEFALADALKLGGVSACLAGEWVYESSTPIPGQAKHKENFRLRAKLMLRYASPTQTQVNIVSHTIRTDKTEYLIARNDEPFPTPGQFLSDPYSKLREAFALASTYAPANDTRALLVTPTQRADVRAAIDARYDRLQRQTYDFLARMMAKAGHPLHVAAHALTGAKELYTAYILLGFPLSVQHNEILRGLVFGDEGLVLGVDVGGDNGLLDDVRSMYAHFAQPGSDLPDTDLLDGIRVIATHRRKALLLALKSLIATVSASGVEEGRDLVDATLLRLSLLLPRS